MLKELVAQSEAMPRWSGDIIGKRLQHLGTVVASDERRALEEAIKHFRGTASTAEQGYGDEDSG